MLLLKCEDSKLRNSGGQMFQEVCTQHAVEFWRANVARNEHIVHHGIQIARCSLQVFVEDKKLHNSAAQVL